MILEKREVRHLEPVQIASLLNSVLSVHVQTYNSYDKKGSGCVHSDVVGQVTKVSLGG